MKKVLFIAIDSPGYCSDGMAAAFNDVGFDEVIKFDWQKWRFQHGIESLRQKLISLAKENKPDLIFLHIQNREILDVDTAKELQSVAQTVNYTFDVRDSCGWYADIATHISLTVFACDDDVWECKSKGIDNVVCLQSSANFDWYKRLHPKRKLSFAEKRSAPEIVFLGNNYENTNLKFEGAIERQRMVEFLYDTFGERFGAYGLGQKNKLTNAQEEINIYNNCKIAICQNLMYRTNFHSDRIWRAMGSGVFVLTKKVEGIENIFKKNVHLDWWRTFEELESLIEFWLYEEEEREAIATVGMNFVRENYRWQDCFKKFLDIIKTLP